jgi:hypothetical protein
MPMNLRPKNDPSAPAYSPHRDLAYIGPGLLLTAARQMDSEGWSEEFARDLAAANVTVEQFGEVTRAVADAVRLFLEGPSIKDPFQAVEQTGLFKVPGLASRLYFSAFGELVFTVMLRGIREVTKFNEDPIVQGEYAAYLAHAEEYLRKRGYELSPGLATDATDIHDLRMKVAHQAGMIQQLNEQIDNLLSPEPSLQ